SAGLDPPGIERESVDLNSALCKAQHCPTRVVLKTHDHISVADAIGTSDTELTDAILAFAKMGKPTNCGADRLAINGSVDFVRSPRGLPLFGLVARTPLQCEGALPANRRREAARPSGALPQPGPDSRWH